jgi:osmotically-inducible protein OsmY
MSNGTLRLKVEGELLGDPRLDARAIAVAVDGGGAVTLRGTVSTMGEKLRAARSAMHVEGVTKVHNYLVVAGGLPGDGHADTVLRAQVLEDLMLNERVPASVDATVCEGIVTLSGTVRHEHEREEAERVAANVPGVAGIKDHILVDDAG